MTDQCKLCGTYIPLGTDYCSIQCKRLHLTPRKVIIFGVVFSVCLAVSILMSLLKWPK